MSVIEHELRLLEIDTERVIEKIESLGGKLVGIYDFRRYVFNTIPEKKGRWVRLRTNGQTATLTVKQIDTEKVDGTSEWEVDVSDFDTTLKVLEKIGLNPKGYQENKRTEYKLGNVMLAIDTWPMIPPYLEIEAETPNEIEAAAKELGFAPDQLTADSPQKIYLRYGIDIETEPNLSFNI